ncbi:MAG TPA: cupin domain-containing protein [Thermoanaerobaculia bacterium]
MLIRSVDPGRLVDAYDVKEQMFYPWPEVVTTPFGTGWLVVEPGRRTKPHNHHEHETFFILRGRGRMTAGGDSREVGPGDVIYLPPFGDHILENLSPCEDLHFVSIWWEDPAVLAGLKEPPASGRPRLPRRTLAVAVCAGGARGPAAADLAGPVLGTEILARFASLQGATVRTRLDLVSAPAALPKLPALPALPELPELPEDTPSDDPAPALALCERLQAAGAVALRSRPARLCVALAGHEEAVRRHYERTAMSPRLRALVDAALDRGLPELAIRQPAEPGAAPPPPGLSGPPFERWFARAARVLLADTTDTADTGESAESAATAGDAAGDDSGRPVVFLGLGEAFHYAVVLPALAEAAGAPAFAPLALVEAEDYRAALAGFAISDPATDAAAGAISDAAASATASATGGGETPARWQPWLRGLAERIAQDHQGQAPPTQAWTREQQRFAGGLLRLAEEAAAAYQPATFSPAEAARLLDDLVRAASAFAAAEEPWRRVASRREERNTGVALELLAAKLLAQLAHPLAPAWSARLWRSLGFASPLGEGGEGSWEEVPTFVPSGNAIRGLGELAPARPVAADPARPAAADPALPAAAAPAAGRRGRRRAPAGRAREAGSR